jgi:hypothetical protein
LFAALPAAASATPCGFGTLASYMAPGFSCTLASATLSGFTFSSSASGGATALNSNDIYVDPTDYGPADGFSIDWESPSFAGLGSTVWQATAGQQLNFAITYSAADAPGYLLYYYSPIPETRLTGDGTWSEFDSVSSPSVGVVASETGNVCGPLITNCPPNEGGIDLQTVAPYDLADFIFTNSYTLDGGHDGSVTFLDNWTATNEETAAVPEPATLLLFGMGLAVLGMANLRRQKSGNYP